MRKVVPLGEVETHDIVNLWNTTIGDRFPMTIALWTQNTSNDPNVIQKGSIAIIENGELIGFIVSKRFQEELDANMSTSVGWIQSMIVKNTFRKQGIGTLLLQHAEMKLKEAGVNEIHLGRDPWHYFPGVPLEDKLAIEWFTNQGYVKKTIETDLKRDVSDVSPYPLTNSNDHYRLLKNEELPLLLQFLKRSFPGRWHYEAVHYDLLNGSGREFIGFFIDGELRGFCRINDSLSPVIAQNVYWSALGTGEMGGIGPLGIERSIRGKHFGLDLVKVAANELIGRGVKEIVIDWTQLVSFYEKIGFGLWKEYQAMVKTVGVD